MGNEVQKQVLLVLNNMDDTFELNQNCIVIILKGNNPTPPIDYRSTDLCNEVIKIIARVVTNKIKHIFLKVVDMEHNVFV